MKNKTLATAAMAACVVTLFSSCATIFSGTEPMTVTTSYQTYEDVVLPATVKVERKHLGGQHIRITSPNYTYEDIVLNRKVNGWAFGNILIGGLIGLAVDLGTNAVSKPGQDVYYIKSAPKSSHNVARSIKKEE